MANKTLMERLSTSSMRKALGGLALIASTGMVSCARTDETTQTPAVEHASTDLDLGNYILLPDSTRFEIRYGFPDLDDRKKAVKLIHIEGTYQGRQRSTEEITYSMAFEKRFVSLEHAPEGIYGVLEDTTQAALLEKETDGMHRVRLTGDADLVREAAYDTTR